MLAPYANDNRTLSPRLRLFNSSKTILEFLVDLIGILTQEGFNSGIRTDKPIIRNIYMFIIFYYCI